MATEAKWSDLTRPDGARALAAANQLLPPWVALVLVIAIGWQLANIIWMLIPGPAAGDAVIVPAGQAITGRSESLPIRIATFGSFLSAIRMLRQAGHRVEGVLDVHGSARHDMAVVAGAAGVAATQVQSPHHTHRV